MDTLQSVEEFLVLTQPINANQGDTIEDLTDGQLAFLDADSYHVLSTLSGKNKVFIAMKYSEEDIRITEWQIKNTKSMTKKQPRDMACAIKSFQVLAATLGAEDAAATSDAVAGYVLLNDYYVRIHVTNPFAENTLAYNETIMVPAGTRLHQLTTGLSPTDHVANVQATVLIGFMKQLIQRSKRTVSTFTPYLCNITDTNLNDTPIPQIDAIGTEFKTANIWDETDAHYGLDANALDDYAIVLVGGYCDISNSVHGVYNKNYRKRRVYGIDICDSDFQYSFGNIQIIPESPTVLPNFYRDELEAIGLGIDLQQVELFDSGNFDKWGTPNYRSTVDGEPFYFDFKTSPREKYVQYMIESINEDINGENRMYRHPVQWRLLVPVDDANTAAICTSLETILNSIDLTDLRFKSTELTPDNSQVTLAVLEAGSSPTDPFIEADGGLQP
jgi:hypothetical protein